MDTLEIRVILVLQTAFRAWKIIKSFKLLMILNLAESLYNIQNHLLIIRIVEDLNYITDKKIKGNVNNS